MPKPTTHSNWILQEQRWLLLLCIVLPILFLFLLELTRNFYLAQLMSRTQERITVVIIIVVGVFIFSSLIFAFIRRLQNTSREQRQQLKALNEIGLKLATEHQMDDVIELVLHSASITMNVRFGVLVTVNNDGTSSNFIVCENNRCNKQTDHLPSVTGALSAILLDGRSLLVNELHDQPQFEPIFPGHPPVRRLIGVPIINRGKVIGGIYLCDRRNDEPFTHSDLSTLSLLAAQSAVAVENARIYERLGRLSVLEERQRIAMDLHDGAIQSLYALGLRLESLTGQGDRSEYGYINVEGARDKICHAITDINLVIKDLRNYISNLNHNEKQSPSIVTSIHEEAVRLRAHGISQIDIEISPSLLAEQDSQLFAIERALHECVSNVIRHSKATAVRLSINCQPDKNIIQVKDNGVGANLEKLSHQSGLGLKNISTRLGQVKGKIELEASPGQGFSISMLIPTD